MFSEMMEISIRISGTSDAAAGVAVRMVHGQVTSVTEKAVKVTNEFGSAWFPKSALKNIAGDAALFKTAHWFKVGDAAFRISTVGVLAFRH